MGRLRGIKDAMEDIKAADPKTAINEHLLRKLVTEGSIPSIKSGWKYLVDMDAIDKYFYGKNK